MRQLKPWEKTHSCVEDEEEIVKIFLARRKRSLGLLAAAASILLVLPHILLAPSFEQPLGKILFFVFMQVAAIAGIFAIYKYRCPRCNRVPRSAATATRGVLLFPRRCANCGAPLMPTHPWATD